MAVLEIVGTEIAYAVVIAGICLAIYLKTRDILMLTKHPGIFHFRNIFLFFAFAYVFRLITVLVLVSFAPFGMMGFHQFQLIYLLMTGYFSTMAILSLTMTVLRKTDSGHNMNWMHLTAILLPVAVIFLRLYELLLLAQTLLFAGSVFQLFLRKGGHSKLSLQNRVTYLLLFGFWIINLFASLRGFSLDVRIILYAISVAIFFWIYFRVKKRLDHEEKKKQARNNK